MSVSRGRMYTTEHAWILDCLFYFIFLKKVSLDPTTWVGAWKT